MTHTVILIISIALLIPGIVLAIIPNIPGLFYMLAITLIFGVYDNFIHLTSVNIVELSALVIVATAADLFSGMAGAKWGGAHWKSLIAGIVGLILGSFVIPVPIAGSLIGMFLGILISEWYRTESFAKAHRAAMGSFAGTVVGTIVKGVAAVAFVILFIIFAVK